MEINTHTFTINDVIFNFYDYTNEQFQEASDILLQASQTSAGQILFQNDRVIDIFSTTLLSTSSVEAVGAIFMNYPEITGGTVSYVNSKGIVETATVARALIHELSHVQLGILDEIDSNSVHQNALSIPNGNFQGSAVIITNAILSEMGVTTDRLHYLAFPSVHGSVGTSWTEGSEIVNAYIGIEENALLGNDEVMNGGNGAELFLGGVGNDTINSGGGNDYVYGGEDTDTLIFNGNFGNDKVAEGEIIIINSGIFSGTATDDDNDGLYTLNGFGITEEENGVLIKKRSNSILLTDWEEDGDYGIELKSREERQREDATDSNGNPLYEEVEAPAVDGHGNPVLDENGEPLTESQLQVEGAKVKVDITVEAEEVFFPSPLEYGSAPPSSPSLSDFFFPTFQSLVLNHTDRADIIENMERSFGDAHRGTYRIGETSEHYWKTGYYPIWGENPTDSSPYYYYGFSVLKFTLNVVDIFMPNDSSLSLGNGPSSSYQYNIYGTPDEPTPHTGFYPDYIVIPRTADISGGFSTSEDQQFMADSDGGAINGSYGDDSFAGGAGTDDFSGGAGNDTLLGEGGDDTLYGEAGDDLADGGDGDDLLIGGTGAGNDTYVGGAGIDVIAYTSTTQGVIVDLAAGTATGAEIDSDSISGIENVVGGTGADSIIGDANDNVLDGAEGNDTISGDGGNDTLLGGLGDDSITGDAGDNLISGGDGVDTLLGGAGEDSIDGNDSLLGESGDDSLAGDDGDDVLEGGDGNDTLIGGQGADTMRGGLGADLFILNAALVATTDSIEGFDVADGDVIDLSAFDDITGFSQLSITDNGGTSTTIALDGTTSLVLDVAAASLGADDFIFAEPDVTTIDGTNRRDDLTGTSGDDLMSGGLGRDTINGAAGNDTINGDNGRDSLLGGEGNDLMNGGNGKDIIDGGTGDDTLYGSFGRDTLTGGTGDDSLFGEQGKDVIDAGDGNDTVLGGKGADSILGGSGNDSLLGEAGRDTIDGGSGDDIIIGGRGADLLIGDDGDDVLTGELGRDTIIGGLGADTLQGNEGADTFVFTSLLDSTTTSTDHIEAYTRRDTFDVSGLGFSSILFDATGTTANSDATTLRYTHDVINGTDALTTVIDDTSGFSFTIEGHITLENADFLF